MNQEQLNEIAANHLRWLESQGEDGERANFSNDYLNTRFSNFENVSTLQIREDGGYTYGGGRGVNIDTGELAGTLIQCANLDFSGFSLNGANLSGAIFYNCKMHNTSINSDSLNAAIFVQSDLYLAYFFGVKELSGSTFISCKLANIHLQGKDLSGSNFCRSNFKNCSIDMSNLSNVMMYGCQAFNCNFSRSQLTNANLESSTFEQCTLEYADVIGAKMNKCTLKDLSISKLKFKPVSNSIFKKVVHMHHGMRLQNVYGDPLLEKRIKDTAYIEAISESHPFLYKLWLASSDCGRSTIRWAIWVVALVLFFAFVYTIQGAGEFVINGGLIHLTEHPAKEFAMFTYYSVVTFTTLGFGDITPKSILSMVTVVAEVILGYLMLGVLITLVANKLGK